MCEQEVEVMEVALGSVFPILLSSGELFLKYFFFFCVILISLGVIWPAEGMPPIMRFLSNFTPLTHVVEAMRCIVSRGMRTIFLNTYLI